MKNQTSIKYFHIMVFSDNMENKTVISIILFLLYFVGVLVNSSIIAVIFLEAHLHKPMFLFICNLSIVDILYTTVIVPKYLEIILSGNNIITFAQCLTQFYFYCAIGITEDILLFIMAYDRYVAICLPLHYHRILRRRNCTLITMGQWITSCSNALLFTVSVKYMSSCHSNIIHQFFCDVKSFTLTTCTGTRLLYIISFDILLFGIVPFLFTLISYINIFSIILHMKSSEGRRKAFSTCSSHLSIISMYYASGLLALLLPLHSDVLDFAFTTFYTAVTPVLNPIIYSLQNADVKVALRRLVRLRHS